MGIHAGDVVIRDGDLFGEAVNVAARLEPLAPPGGICISAAVLDQIRRKVHAQIVALGEVELKNISKPMSLFVLRPGEEMVSGLTGMHRARGKKAPFRRWPAIVAVAGGAAVLAATAPLAGVEMEDGATTLRLRLRPDVFFHDSRCFPGGRGPAARSHDVVFSIEQAARHDSLPLPVVGIDEFLAGKADFIAGITTSGGWRSA